MPISSKSGIAICCEGIGKRYQIGAQVRYRTLRDSLASAMRAPWAWLAREQRPELWALRDVSLEVKRGEVLGIIGRNGSGKSTLLKVLSRITRPTEGKATLYGRVGTLLEVGAGFHPELTGRENIYLNGAILGMSHREIDRKFKEIVEFAECGRMLDTAMKHYSSGMYVRLGFAVAAHLETEILLLDEALAVGDAAFQQKCLGKMGEVAHEGRTVLFVSHNMLAVNGLCTRAICLHEGQVVLDGSPATVTSTYLRKWLPKHTEIVYDDPQSAPGNESVRLHRVRVHREEDAGQAWITVRTAFAVEIEYWKLTPETKLRLVTEVLNEHGVNVFTTARMESFDEPVGLLRAWFRVPPDLMNNGIYRINIGVWLGGETNFLSWEDVAVFEVHDEAGELRGDYYDEWSGTVRPFLTWQTELLEHGVHKIRVNNSQETA